MITDKDVRAFQTAIQSLKLASVNFFRYSQLKRYATRQNLVQKTLTFDVYAFDNAPGVTLFAPDDVHHKLLFFADVMTESENAPELACVWINPESGISFKEALGFVLSRFDSIVLQGIENFVGVDFNATLKDFIKHGVSVSINNEVIDSKTPILPKLGDKILLVRG